MRPKIIFFQVPDSSSKLSKICHTALHHFAKKEPLLILVPDQTVLEYVDALLWKYPEESFLPHGLSLQDIISISTTPIGQKKYIFNLCPHPVDILEEINTIYELEDLSSPVKLQASQSRYQHYRLKECPISSEL